jgi:hypothetical protein
MVTAQQNLIANRSLVNGQAINVSHLSQINAQAVHHLTQAQRAHQLVDQIQANINSQAQYQYNMQYGSEGSEEELDSEK